MGSLDRANLGEYLSAYLDDELTAEERTAVEKWITGDAEVRAQYDDLRRTVDMVRSLPRRAAPPGMVDDLTAMAERRQLLDEGVAWSPRPHLPWWRSASTWLSAAAVLLIAVGGGFFVSSQLGQPDGDAGRLGDGTLALATKDDSIESQSADRLLKAESAAPDASEARDDVADRKHAADRTASIADELDQDVDRAMSPSAARPTPVADPSTDVRSRFQLEEGAVVAMNRDDRERVRRDGGLADFDQHLSLEKKLAADAPADALVEHDVSVEQNHLYVAVRDEHDIALAEQQLNQFAISNQYQNVEPSTPTIHGGDPLVMRQGRAKSPMGEEVVAVARVPASQLMALQQSLENGTNSRRSMQMRIGPVKAYGNAEVAETIQSMQSSRRRAGVRRQPADETSTAQAGAGRSPASKAAMPDRIHDLTTDEVDESAFGATADTAHADAAGDTMRPNEQGRAIVHGPDVETLHDEPGRDSRSRREPRARRVVGEDRAPIAPMQSESGELRAGKDSPSTAAGGDARSTVDEIADANGRTEPANDDLETTDRPVARESEEPTTLLSDVGRAFQQVQRWFAAGEGGGSEANDVALDEDVAFPDATAIGPADDEDELVTLVIHFQLPTAKAKKIPPGDEGDGGER